MATKMIGVRPDSKTLKQIEQLARKENRPEGPMVVEICRRYFAGEKAAT